MMTTRIRLAASMLAAILFSGLSLGSPGDEVERVPVERVPLTAREKAVHVWNRLGFGPRPGDVDNVLRIGVSAWIEQQLLPQRISDASVQAKLAKLPTLRMSSGDLFDKFERPLHEARQERKRELAAKGETGEIADADLEKMKEMIPPEKRPRRIIEELSSARVLRAVYSERQLNEVMVDFWMNHFNIYAAKGLDRIFVTAFEEDVVRPRVWGRFDDLLLATAKSPAMLFYLDNAQSAADENHRPVSPIRGGPRRARFAGPAAVAAPAKKKMPSGLNENYARELMELHTLGVDGGYTQRDVTELARVLTGWSIERQGGGFLFRPALHDVGEKTVLGIRFPASGGMEEGERAIRILAHHPATARHIATQLCQRLVADDPPKELVARVAQRFLATDGDLRETVRAIVESREFFDPKFYRAKVKSPFEYAVSAVRAAGGETDGALPMVRAIAQMGEPLYLCQPPTGYSDASSAWVNTGALVARLNFALDVAENRIPGTAINVESLRSRAATTDTAGSIQSLARTLTGWDLSDETRETISKRLRDESREDGSSEMRLPLMAGLILGSPEFQRQ